MLALDDQVRLNPTTLGALYAGLAYQANHWLTEPYPQARPFPVGLLPAPDRPAFMGATPGQLGTTRAYHLQALELFREALASGNLSAALPKAEQAAEALGLRIDWHSKAMGPQVADAGATGDQAFAIGGWLRAGSSPGNSIYLHSEGLSPVKLREVINRLAYPGLALPRVYKPKQA